MSKFFKTTLFFVLYVFIGIVGFGQNSSENATKSEKPVFKGNVTYLLDVREYNSYGIWMKKSNMKGGFSFLGFTDVHGDQFSGKNRFRLTRAFSEYRLTNDILGRVLKVRDLGFHSEFNRLSPEGKNRLRFGVIKKFHFKTFGKLNGFLNLRVMPLENEITRGQVSLFLYFPIYKKSVILSGFCDFNYKYNKKGLTIVSEPALFIRLKNSVFLMLEARYNENDNKLAKGTKAAGFAAGLKVDF